MQINQATAAVYYFLRPTFLATESKKKYSESKKKYSESKKKYKLFYQLLKYFFQLLKYFFLLSEYFFLLLKVFFFTLRGQKSGPEEVSIENRPMEFWKLIFAFQY